MKDFAAIKRKCDETTEAGIKLIDGFLIWFAASRNNLDRRMEQDFARFRHITRSFSEELTNRLKAQYIVHKIFRKDGLINKFLGNPELKRLSAADISFLQYQAENPWKFSFAVIIDFPAENFFMMEDVFTSEQYLLYSPGITETLKESNPLLWFNTISYNGECWQSFGVIASYQSFGPDDIYFFATELNPDITGGDEIIKHIEDDPLPYMMLLSGARMPLLVHNDDLIVHTVSEFEPGSFSSARFSADFDEEYNNGVYRLSLKEWDGEPHKAYAYYDEAGASMLLSAMTDKGYDALARKLISLGEDAPAEPFVRVGLSMLTTASDILRRKINLVPYEHLFLKKSSGEEKADLEMINRVISMIIPEINAGRKPDAEKLASLTGADIETVNDIIAQLSRR